MQKRQHRRHSNGVCISAFGLFCFRRSGTLPLHLSDDCWFYCRQQQQRHLDEHVAFAAAAAAAVAIAVAAVVGTMRVLPFESPWGTFGCARWELLDAMVG